MRLIGHAARVREQVPAAVRFLHPTHNFALVQYDPSCIEGEGAVASAPLSETPIEVGGECTFVGLSKTDAAALPSRVAALGGTLAGEVSFTDAYWDNAGCTLTRRDTWLRQREGKWEIKIPLGDPGDRSGASGGERTVFREVEGEAAVRAALESLLDGGALAGAGDLEATLRAAAFAPFVTFGTKRSKFRVGECAIDADVASFGHSVVEVEVMCESEAAVPEAEAAIARVAGELQLVPLQNTGGKLETCIRREAPAVLAALVEEGILKP